MPTNLNIPIVNQLLNLWNTRGQQTSNNIISLFQLYQYSTVYNLSSVAGSVVLLAQAYAQAQVIAGQVIMSDSLWDTLSIPNQGQIYEAFTNWIELETLLGSVAFQENFPVLDTIIQPSSSARLFGALTANPSTINLQLETFLSVPTLVGITPNTFWSITTAAREELSSVISVDLVLEDNLSFFGFSSNYEFISTVIDILTNMVPLTVNVSALLTQIQSTTATGTQTSQFNSVQAVTVPPNSTLEALSLQYTGNADNWEQIAFQNNLIYPYITNNPIVQLGNPYFSTVLLQTNVTSGSNSFAIGNVIGISQGCTLLLQSGNLYDILEVGSVSTLDIDSISTLIDTWDLFDNSGVINTLGTCVNSYNSTNTIVSIYLDSADQGVVASAGDTILIPINSNAANNTNVISQQQEDVFLYGVDIQTTNGLLSVTNGDLSIVTGIPNVVQAISNQFATPQNTLVEHPQYGSNLETFIGQANSPYNSSLAAISGIQTALSDPRISSASNTSTVVSGDTINIDLTVVLIDGTTVSPVRLSTPITFGS